MTTTTDARVLLVSSGTMLARDHTPVSGRVHVSDYAVLGEFHRLASYSLDHGMRWEGWELWTVTDTDTWTPDAAREMAATARNVFRHEGWHDHPARATEDDGGPFTDEDMDLIRENCGGCALRGYGAHTDGGTAPLGPNYGGWGRLFVETGTPVREEWHTAFLAELGQDTPYGVALRRSVRTFGVRGGVPLTADEVMA